MTRQDKARRRRDRRQAKRRAYDRERRSTLSELEAFEREALARGQELHRFTWDNWRHARDALPTLARQGIRFPPEDVARIEREAAREEQELAAKQPP